MALKNQPITVSYLAWNSFTGAPQASDVANHTLRLIQDGVEGAPTNAPAADDAARPGVYTLALAAADMNYDAVTVCGISSTPHVTILPVQVLTERGVLPSAAPAATGGLPVVGSAPLSNLDAAVSSRLAASSYAAPPTTAQIATAILANPSIPIATASGGVVQANVVQWLDAAPPTPAVAGVPIVDQHYGDGLADTAACQGGSNTTAILASTESTSINYASQYIAFNSGACAAQARLIVSSAVAGSQVTVTVDRPWDGGVSPASGDTYRIGGYGVTRLDPTQPVPFANTAGTVGDALNAARAQGFGAWSLTGTTLTLYASDGATVVRTFALDSATAPTSRT